MHKTAIYKTLHYSDTPAQLDDLQAKVSELYGDSVDVIRNGPNTLEVLSERREQGCRGLKAAAEYLGLDASQFVVFGDGNNDPRDVCMGWIQRPACITAALWH